MPCSRQAREGGTSSLAARKAGVLEVCKSDRLVTRVALAPGMSSVMVLFKSKDSVILCTTA